MVAYLRTALSQAPQRWSICSTRSISSSSILRKERPSRADEDGDEEGGRRAVSKDPSWKEWAGTVGKQFAESHHPRNWLGNQVVESPFPLNPSFQPPTPVSESIRNTMYKQFMANPETNSVRNLASRYHLSIKRVEAILRLKGLEAHWIKGKPLQTGFRVGMEKLLGVKADAEAFTTHEQWVKSRSNVIETDTMDQVDGNDPARSRYQHMFWEPVAEGSEPILPAMIDKARTEGKKSKKEDGAQKSDDLGRHHNQAKKVVTTSGDTSGRPMIEFVDVGGKFLDPRDQQSRTKESERRARLRTKKRQSPQMRSTSQESVAVA